MVLTEAMSSSSIVKAHYQEFLEERRRGIRRWLRALRPADADPDVAAARERSFALALNSSVVGLHLQAVIDPEGIELEPALAALEELFGRDLEELWTTPVATSRLGADA